MESWYHPSFSSSSYLSESSSNQPLRNGFESTPSYFYSSFLNNNKFIDNEHQQQQPWMTPTSLVSENDYIIHSYAPSTVPEPLLPNSTFTKSSFQPPVQELSNKNSYYSSETLLFQKECTKVSDSVLYPDVSSTNHYYSQSDYFPNCHDKVQDLGSVRLGALGTLENRADYNPSNSTHNSLYNHYTSNNQWTSDRSSESITDGKFANDWNISTIHPPSYISPSSLQLYKKAEKKRRVLSIAPDAEMKFLLNLSPSLNSLQQSWTLGKVIETPFSKAFQNFIKGEKKEKCNEHLEEKKPIISKKSNSFKINEKVSRKSKNMTASLSNNESKKRVQRAYRKEKQFVSENLKVENKDNEEETEYNFSQMITFHRPTHESGDFIILKSDISQDNPPIWKLDSKTLLVRYNRDENYSNELFYKSSNLFSGYSDATSKRYRAILIESITSEGLVKLSKNSFSEKELRIHSIKETTQYAEHFTVYIETLFSLVLNDNFLLEVFSKEEDNYFLSSLKKIDLLSWERKNKIRQTCEWSIEFEEGLHTWPNLHDLGYTTLQNAICDACERGKSKSMYQMFGQPYDQRTLKALAPSEQSILNRNFSLCSKCARSSTLYHGLHHIKHNVFETCFQVIQQRGPSFSDSGVLLLEILKNKNWIKEQFQKLQELWSQADCFLRYF